MVILLGLRLALGVLLNLHLSSSFSHFSAVRSFSGTINLALSKESVSSNLGIATEQIVVKNEKEEGIDEIIFDSAVDHTVLIGMSGMSSAGKLNVVSSGTNKKFFIETHGCQMNLADSDVVRRLELRLWG
jgi:hypothetical protein